MGCVYKITSPSGKIYIGKSMDYEKRKYNYSMLSCKTQKKLYNSFIKYGFDAHIFSEIYKSDIESDLNEKEKSLIKEFDSFRFGLNMTLGGEGFCGRKHTEETKKKIGDKRKGKKLTAAQKAKIGLKSLGNKYCLGKKLTPEHKAKIIGTGRVLGPMLQSTKDKISSSKMGTVSWNKGQKLSGNHREKVLAFNTSKKKGIIQINKSGGLIKEFDSLVSAANELSLSKGNISNCLTGRINHTKGFMFKYKVA